MKIISKIKDYYDYMQSVYGIDDLVVYDRRECQILNIDKIVSDYGDEWFKQDKMYWDKPKKTIKYYSSQSLVHKINNEKIPFKKNQNIEEGMIEHFVLEIGFFHYLFEIERYLDENDKLVLEYRLLSVKRKDKDHRFSDYPMAIAKVRTRYGYFFYKDDDWEIEKKTIKGNPILINTWIPKVIPPNEVWEHLYEYVSSLNDKDIVDSRTNNEHIESNGFDTKISFRGKIKKK